MGVLDLWPWPSFQGLKIKWSHLQLTCCFKMGFFQIFGWPWPLTLTLFSRSKGHLSHSNWFRLFTINSLRVLKFCVKIIEFQGAITLSRIIGHAIQKRRIISLFRSYYTLIFMHVLQAVFEIDWEQGFRSSRLIIS